MLRDTGRTVARPYHTAVLPKPRHVKGAVPCTATDCRSHAGSRRDAGVGVAHREPCLHELAAELFTVNTGPENLFVSEEQARYHTAYQICNHPLAAGLPCVPARAPKMLQASVLARSCDSAHAEENISATPGPGIPVGMQHHCQCVTMCTCRATAEPVPRRHRVSMHAAHRLCNKIPCSTDPAGLQLMWSPLHRPCAQLEPSH